MPPATARQIAWLMQPTEPPKCYQNGYQEADLGTNTSSDVHKLAAWTQPPPCQSKGYGPCYYLYFQINKPKLTPQFSSSCNIMLKEVNFSAPVAHSND